SGGATARLRSAAGNRRRAPARWPGGRRAIRDRRRISRDPRKQNRRVRRHNSAVALCSRKSAASASPMAGRAPSNTRSAAYCPRPSKTKLPSPPAQQRGCALQQEIGGERQPDGREGAEQYEIGGVLPETLENKTAESAG